MVRRSGMEILVPDLQLVHGRVIQHRRRRKRDVEVERCQRRHERSGWADRHRDADVRLNEYGNNAKTW